MRQDAHIPALEYRLACIDKERERQRLLARESCVVSASVVRGATALASVASGRGAAAPSLEEVTLDDRTEDNLLLEPSFGDASDDGVWKIRKTFFSSGVCEVRAFLGSAPTRIREQSSSESTRPDQSESAREGRFESSIARSRRVLRERCLELDATHMLTLTKRGKFSSIDETWAAWRRFSRLMKKFYREKWRYVVVPELHSDGETYHLHVAIRGFFWAGIVRKIWQKALGGTGYEHGEGTLGNIDLKSFRRVRGAAGVRRIAGYIAKYVGKGFTACNRGRRLFASSGGLDPHRTERRVVRYWSGTRELVRSVQAGLLGVGSSGIGTCYFWSRERSDGTLMSRGFVLTTDWRGVAS